MIKNPVARAEYERNHDNHLARGRAYYLKRREQKLAYAKVYQKTHSEQIRIREKKWRSRNMKRLQAKNRAYYFANKEAIYARIKRRHASNPEVRKKRAESVRKYRSSHRTECNARERERRKKRPDLFRKRMLKSQYGMTPQQYDSLLLEQNGVCAICKNGNDHGTNSGNRTKHLTVDHCHATGAIRGLLCHKCNAGLGYFKDNPEVISAALVYLHRFSAPYVP